MKPSDARVRQKKDQLQQARNARGKSWQDDLLAVLTTGAYNFTMASNYNRLCRPALVMVRNGKARLAVRRQTFADLVACDL